LLECVGKCWGGVIGCKFSHRSVAVHRRSRRSVCALHTTAPHRVETPALRSCLGGRQKSHVSYRSCTLSLAAAAARRAAVVPRRWPTPWPMPPDQSRSVRTPSSSSAAILSCLSLKAGGLNLLAHFLPAHPSPRAKHLRCSAMAHARARPASTSAQHPSALHTYTDLAAAASPC